MGEQRIAILDLGTNTFNLLIASFVLGEKPRILLKDRIPVKIGQNGINDGFITPEACSRAILAIKQFEKTIQNFNVLHVKALATSAFRNAKNGKELAENIYQQTKIRIEIIDGNQEAQLIYEGVNSSLDLGIQNSLIMDIGGGSVEFIIANKYQIFWKHSFEIGAQRLLDKFHHNYPISKNEISQINSFLEFQLKDLQFQVDLHKPQILVGSSGAFESFIEMDLASRNLHITNESRTEYELSKVDFHLIYSQLISKNKQEIKEIKGLVEMRLDVIVVASILLNYILESCEINKVKVSTYSLKEGLLNKFLKELE